MRDSRTRRITASGATVLIPSVMRRGIFSALGEDAVLRGAVATALEVARDRLFARTPLRHIQEVSA